MHLSALRKTSWHKRNPVKPGDLRARFAAREDLVALKLASGRERDLKEVDAIRRAARSQKRE